MSALLCVSAGSDLIYCSLTHWALALTRVIVDRDTKLATRKHNKTLITLLYPSIHIYIHRTHYLLLIRLISVAEEKSWRVLHNHSRTRRRIFINNIRKRGMRSRRMITDQVCRCCCVEWLRNEKVALFKARCEIIFPLCLRYRSCRHNYKLTLDTCAISITYARYVPASQCNDGEKNHIL